MLALQFYYSPPALIVRAPGGGVVVFDLGKRVSGMWKAPFDSVRTDAKAFVAQDGILCLGLKNLQTAQDNILRHKQITRLRKSYQFCLPFN